MDIGLLSNRIQSTVDPNADVRRQAELDLRYVSSSAIESHKRGLTLCAQAEEQQGFINGLLDILHSEQDNSIRISGTKRPRLGELLLTSQQLPYI